MAYTYTPGSLTLTLILRNMLDLLPVPTPRKLAEKPLKDVGKLRLQEQLQTFLPLLPRNAVDELTDSLGGTEMVAEWTSRTVRFIRSEKGNYIRQPRTHENLKEHSLFMRGLKRVIIISAAASTGCSLQDKTVEETLEENSEEKVKQRRRIHFTLELSWSAEQTLQQAGRSHRADQDPFYWLAISNMAGECCGL